MDDTVEEDQPTPMIAGETPQRPKIGVQRKEHILTPISNGSTPVRVSFVSYSFPNELSLTEKHFYDN